MTGAGAPDRDGHEDHLDGCVCDLQIGDEEIMRDEELPATQGGVQFTSQQSAAGEDIDGCDVEFTEEGKWNIVGLVSDGNGYTVGGTGVTVAANEEIPEPGETAPSIHTPTADEVADLSEIDTRIPPSSLHEDDLADALGK